MIVALFDKASGGNAAVFKLVAVRLITGLYLCINRVYRLGLVDEHEFSHGPFINGMGFVDVDGEEVSIRSICCVESVELLHEHIERGSGPRACDENQGSMTGLVHCTQGLNATTGSLLDQTIVVLIPLHESLE